MAQTLFKHPSIMRCLKKMQIVALLIIGTVQVQASTIALIEMDRPAAGVAPHHEADSRIDLQLNLPAL